MTFLLTRRAAAPLGIALIAGLLAAPVARSVPPLEFSRDVIERSERIPVAVEFYATWCAACHRFRRTLDRIHAEFQDRLVVVRIDAEAHPTLAERFRVRAYPTLVMFDGGGELDRVEGDLEAEALRDLFDRYALVPDPAARAAEESLHEVP
jgi:thioredoxin-like negative regulator of GroEL